MYIPREPKAPCRVVGAEQRNENRHAVYARVIVEDADGKRWSFDAAAFNFQLEPLPDPQSIEKTAG